MWLFSSVAMSTPAAWGAAVNPGPPPNGKPEARWGGAEAAVRVAGGYHVAGGDQRAQARWVQAKGRKVPLPRRVPVGRREDFRQGERRQLLGLEEGGRRRRR